MKISMYAAISIDGFIARADGSIDWLGSVEETVNDFDYQEFYASVDALVMGGKTYRQLASSNDWLYAEKPVWVYSRDAFAPVIPNVFRTEESPVEFAGRLQSEGKEHLWVVGGGDINSMFLRENLIDDMRIFVIPLALGAGIPLFAPIVPEQRWNLTATRQWKGGIIEMQYTK